ncbi:hypothetical protein SCHPADRAFT_325445 [Schizopora paradoxa]|uniref:WD40 repeat-like protein n=1 Tax=Schizopora paradoxa TaxID=27342 RepID=A0A0H2SBB4_9AGAM|nr:hypothetical protein SCHPADRAFT_325445 [Schizopora paradoxa]
MSGSARSLRPRSSRPSYAQYVDENAEVDGDSSSDEFEPAKEVEGNDEEEENEEGEGSDEDAEGEIDEDAIDTPVASTSTSKIKAKDTGTKKAKSKPTMRSTPSFSAATAAMINAPVARKNYAKPHPIPNNDHRYRAQPLYQKQCPVARLATPSPEDLASLGPFNDWEVKKTRNWTSDPSITERIGKASGNNAGRGPIWEFMEDRSWFKEAFLHVSETQETWTEAFRRPRVYPTISPGKRWSYLDAETAASYLTKDKPLTCLVGPMGNQRQIELKSLEPAISLSHSSAHIYNVGAPVSCLDWCPIFSGDSASRRFKQYLAVAPLTSKDRDPLVGVKCTRPSEACIQIWSLGLNEDAEDDDASSIMESGKMNCEMVLCIDSGFAQALQWCPLPSNDPWHIQEKHETCRKLGVLGGTFEDGSLSIFVVPDPEDVRGEKKTRSFVKIEPVVRIELEETSCLSFDWANSTRLAVGCTNGSVAIYDIDLADLCSRSETSIFTDILPSYYVSVHQSAVRSITWFYAPPISASGEVEKTRDPTIVSTGGYDGCLNFLDLREAHYSTGNVVNRTRDVLNSITYSHQTVGIIGTDGDNTVKTFSVHPATLGRGHVLVESNSPVWSLGVSDYHAHVAVGCADGSCSTTNTLRSTRRSTSTPFVSYKIFQLDYNRKSGVYRLLDKFLPTEVIERGLNSKPRGVKADIPVETRFANSGAWPANVSVTCVRWNSGGGLTRAPLLASATASGLCRVDWLLGHFARGHVPYGGIKFVRKESGADVKDETDDDLEDEESD